MRPYFTDSFSYANDILEDINLKYVCGYTAYFILGWYLSFNDIKRRKAIYLLGLLSIVAEILVTGVLSIRLNQATPIYYDISVNVLLQSVMAFVFVKVYEENKGFQQNGFIKAVSKYSLGIYAIHAGIITVLYKILPMVGIESAFVAMPIVFVSLFAGAMAISVVMGKIKPLKTFVL